MITFTHKFGSLLAVESASLINSKLKMPQKGFSSKLSTADSMTFLKDLYSDLKF